MDTDILTFDPPFITHAMRLRSTDSDNAFLYGAEWVWEPAPDLAPIWYTQQTTHDLQGWQHIRRGFLAYGDATADVTLLIVTDQGALPVITLPATGSGGYAKASWEPTYNKFLWARYEVRSAEPFRLFKRDCEVYVKAWGSGDAYQIVKPFGDYHRQDGARI
jgi:hypothetical protein